MKFKLIFFFCFFCLLCKAQQKPYPTKRLAVEWLANFKKIESIEDKIESVISKIYFDTLYKKIDFILLDGNPEDSNYKCKTLIFVSAFGKYYKIDLVENPKLNSIIKMLNMDTVNEVKVLESPENVIYFGTDGLCGVVIMETKNKKLVRKIKNIL